MWLAGYLTTHEHEKHHLLEVGTLIYSPFRGDTAAYVGRGGVQ
jgi:hypothetical protein